MPTYCILCGNKENGAFVAPHVESLKYHRFPLNEFDKTNWIEKIKSVKGSSYDHLPSHRVCTNHFESIPTRNSQVLPVLYLEGSIVSSNKRALDELPDDLSDGLPKEILRALTFE